MKEENLGRILINAKKLSNIGRWANEFLHKRQSVAEHSFMVCQIAQLLGLIEEQEAGSQIDWRSLYRKALNHDTPEALVGDVISTTKNINPATKKALDDVEIELVESQLILKLEKSYQDTYRKVIFDGKDDTIEGKILTAADNIDALMECIQEIKLANIDPFLDKYFHICNKVKSIGIYSSQYFVDKILPFLIKDCHLLNRR